MTFDEIRAAARSKADEQATGFIDSTELDQYINQANFMVYAKIVARDEKYFIQKSSTTNTVDGTQEYALPTNTHRLILIQRRQSGSTSERDWFAIRPSNISNNHLKYDWYPGLLNYTSEQTYFLAGNYIYLDPVPTQVYELRFWYVALPTVLTTGSDIPSAPYIYHPLIAEYAALQCLAKSGEGIYQERRDALELEMQNLLDTISPRDQQAEQMVVTDDYIDLYRGIDGL